MSKKECPCPDCKIIRTERIITRDESCTVLPKIISEPTHEVVGRFVKGSRSRLPESEVLPVEVVSEPSNSKM